MKTKAASKSAFRNSPSLLISGFFVAALSLVLLGHGNFPSAEARSLDASRPDPTPAPCAVFAYVSNTGSDNISVIDTSTNTVVATLPSLESGPSGVAINPAGTRAYVANSSGLNPSVSVVDTFHNWIFYVILNGIGIDPVGLAVTPDGSRVYVANQGNGYSTLSIIDTSTNAVVGAVSGLVYPYGVAVKPDGTRVYVTSMGAQNVSVIDTSTNTVVAHVGVTGYSMSIALTPDGTLAYVATHNNSIGRVCVIDTSTNTIAATIPVDSSANAVAINPAGTRAYVTLASNTVAVIDTSTNRVLTTVPVGSTPLGVSVTPDGSRVYVANYNSGTVSVINATSNTVIATVPVGMYPNAVGNFIGAVPCPSPTPTPAPTPTPHPCQLRVLIVYGDIAMPAYFQWEIQHQPSVARVDIFDGLNSTPTLAQLQQYDIVVPLSNWFGGGWFQDSDTLGNNLADYVDGGGVVVQCGFSFRGPFEQNNRQGIFGRWVSESYNPYYYSNNFNANHTPFTLGTFDPSHPLMAGVTALNSTEANFVEPLAAIEVGQMDNGNSLVSFRPVSGGHTTIGVTAYVGDYALQSGDWGRVVVNAGTWLYNCLPGATPTPTPTCEWQFASSMPVDNYGAAGVSDGTYFYAAGGSSILHQVTRNVFYRWSSDPPPNGLWTALAPLPNAVVVATAIYYPPTNKIYIFGGSDGNNISLNITQIYDIASNTWSMGAPMPGVRASMAGGYIPVTGRIYIISGDSNGSVQSAQPNTWAYDPVANAWTDLTSSAPFPHPASGFAYGVINNKLYIAGGRDVNNQLINLTWEYDPLANIYTQKADEPSSFQNNAPGSAAAGGLLWVFGGGSPFNGPGSSYSRLAPNKATFDAKRAAIPPPVGGVTGQSSPNTSAYGRCYDPASDTWTDAPKLAMPRSFPASGAIGDSLLIAAGGYNSNGNYTVGTVQTKTVCVRTLTLTGAVSRKIHGAAGNFDVNLPLAGAPGVENRTTGGTNDYAMVVTFGSNVTVTGNPQAQVTIGTGCVGTGGVCDGNVSVGGNTVTIPLTNIANAQTINVRINGVNGATDAPATDFTIPMSILIGDTNENGTVNAADVAQAKSRLGEAVDTTNFRSDVNANGVINATDVSIVKSKLGTGLP